MSIASTGISDWEKQPGRAAFSVAETAQMLGLSEATIYRLIGRRTLESVLIGGSRRIPATAIQKALTANSAAIAA